MTYASPLANPGSATGLFDVYEAQRSPDGWRVIRRLTPSGDQSNSTRPGGVSADHGYALVNPLGFSIGLPTGSLGQQGVSDYLSRPDGTFEFTARGQLGSEPYGQGRYISEGGQHVIFSTGHDQAQSIWCSDPLSGCKVLKLEPNAPPEGTGAIYDRSADGPTHVVSLLPGDTPQENGQEAFYKGNSRDGSSVAFTIDGTLYVRVHNGEALLEETLKVAEGGPAYAGFSQGGRFLFYVAGGEKGTIHRFDTENEADVEVNPTVPGEVVNVSADGSHVFFIAEEEILGQGEPGKPNLFVWSGLSPEYIGTVAPSDLERTSGNQLDVPALTRWTSYAVAPNSNLVKGPGADSSRSTPDGSVLIFESRAKLTSYANASHTEIYRWEEEGDDLTCVSCNFGEPAEADARLQELRLVTAPIVIHNLSDDGSRVFFESEEALAKDDNDGVNDIYEWHRDGGTDAVHLITSGRSEEYRSSTGTKMPPPDRLLSVTPSGSDVVIRSQDVLVPGAAEGGAPAVYDARIGGGFPESEPPKICREEECRPSGASDTPSSAEERSEVVAGAGNVRMRKHRHHRRRCKRVKGPRGHRRCPKHGSNRRASGSSAITAAVQPQEHPEAGESSQNAAATSPDPVASSDGPEAVPTSIVASGEFAEFGIESVAANTSTTVAGSHPNFTTNIVLNHFINKQKGLPEAKANMEGAHVALPPGLLGNPTAVPHCKTGQLIALGSCPIDTQVGIAKILVLAFAELTEPLYIMDPVHPEGEIARLGFYAHSFPVFIDVHVDTADDYSVTATVEDAPGVEPLLKTETILWSNPTDPIHDEQRLTAFEAAICGSGTACKAPGGKREVPRTNLAFMTNPSACQEGSVDFSVTSYQLPGQVFTASAPLAPITDCTGLPFAPALSAEPTSHVAGAPTGLKTKLVLPQHLMADERATATMREARVTLPEGMQIAAGAANWIGTCSDEQVGYHEEVDTACPDASKLGTAKITSPALSVPIEGTIYQRSPSPGHQLGLWLTADALGLHIKLPGELEPDKTTGRLTAVFRDLPQVPVEEIELNVWGGPRAPLENPDACGTYTTNFSFSPHSNDPAAVGQSTMQITEGCNQGFNPALKAGVTHPIAGKYSPFVFDLTRPDGDQALRGFKLKLPDGELAKIKGVPLCGDADATAGTCPATSRIGSLQATSGPGPEPFTLPEPGKPQPQIYLAGAYQGAPFSIVSQVPAQAGPFDLGTLVVRNGLEVEPETGRAVVKADPLPQFFEGVGIAYRHLHAVVDRPEFSLNPTDCREMAVTSDVASTQGTVAHPSARFQVDGCKALGFKPKLSLKLKGGTKRADYPALTATLKAHKGDANIAFASVALPHSEFLAQEHIGTICTRKQFAADKCPKGSVYGKAKAFTPLLDKPLAGPVYLRSSDHPLPDLVAKLGGQLEIHLVGRIDSKNGGIRTTFESVPDAPVTKFVLQMKGGAKGLLTNSTDICRGAHRASVAMRAQNGRRVRLRPLVQSSGCG